MIFLTFFKKISKKGLTRDAFFVILYKLAREGPKSHRNERAQPNLENDTEKEKRARKANRVPGRKAGREGSERETAKIPKSLASRDVKD